MRRNPVHQAARSVRVLFADVVTEDADVLGEERRPRRPRFAKKEERNSAPSGTLTAQNFFLPSTKIRTVRYNSLSCVLPLGEEAAAGRREGKSLSPSMVYAQPEEGGIAPPKWGAFFKLTLTGTTSFRASAVNPQPFSRGCL